MSTVDLYRKIVVSEDICPVVTVCIIRFNIQNSIPCSQSAFLWLFLWISEEAAASISICNND